MLKVVSNFDRSKNIWSGQDYVPVFNPKMSLGQLLLKMMSRNPDQVIQISADSGIELTSNDIRKRGIRTVRYYTQQGLKEGDVVGIVAGNSAHLTPIVLGSFICGVTISSLAPAFSKSEIAHVYRTSRPKLVFCDAAYYEVVKSALDELGLSLPISTINGSVDGIPSVEVFLENESEPGYNYDDFVCPTLKEAEQVPAAIMCSSGTTGLPKGTYVSQASFITSTELTNLTAKDVLFGFSTIDWYSGIWFLILCLMRGTKRIVTRQQFSSDLMLRIIEKYQVTVLLTPPPQIAMLLQDPNIDSKKLSSLRSFITGGSMVLPNVARKMNTFLKNGRISVIYGMTEVGTIISVNENEDGLHSVGRLTLNIQGKIVDNNNENVGVGEYGEILIKPPHPFLGYCGNPELTKTIFDSDGFIRTGDIGYFDEQGYLVVCDRKKDVISCKDGYYFPSEIENVLMQMPGVAQTCVCGIPGADGNDMAAAFVIKRNGHSLSEQDVWNFTENKLNDFKQLKGGVYFVDSIPLTASGKHQRHIMRDMIIKMCSSRRNLNGNV